MEKKLSEMKPGEKGQITDIDSSIRARVAGMGIRVGGGLKLATEQPMKGPLVVIVNGKEASLGRGLAKLITVDCE